MLILSMLFYKLKWFLVRRPSFFEQRITDNEQRASNNEKKSIYKVKYAL
jgi:hypothetical protein